MVTGLRREEELLHTRGRVRALDHVRLDVQKGVRACVEAEPGQSYQSLSTC